MKWSVLATLLAAPLALAGALGADVVVRTDNKGDMQMGYKDSQPTVIIEAVIIIWVFHGSTAATTTMNTMSSMTSAKSITTHSVTVGGSAGLVYTPETLFAAVGDVVFFTFLSENHTLTQSSFGTPCEALAGGKNSGFMANPNNTVNPPPQMAIQVMVSTPLWFYCQQKGHCGKGMVFSINPTANKTQEMFKQMAIAQNGTGTTAAIVATATTMAGTSMASVATATSKMSAVVPTQTPLSSSGSGLTIGSGFTGTGETCSCSCFCGIASFPSSVQGLEGFGGMPGAMPMAMKS